MSNYEMKCVFPDLFLLKIGEKKRKQKTLANVKFQLWRWFSALWPNFFREKKIKQFLITYMNNYSTRNSNKRGLKKLQSLVRTPYSRYTPKGKRRFHILRYGVSLQWGKIARQYTDDCTGGIFLIQTFDTTYTIIGICLGGCQLWNKFISSTHNL